MVLDFLPYKTPDHKRRKIGWIRYIVFLVSLVFVLALFIADVANIEGIMFWAFIVGNALYYIVGIALAVAFKDNRAFCKYICPITVFLKPMSYFALFRIKCDKKQVRIVWQVQEGLPYGCGCHRQLKKTEERNRVYFMYGVR